MTERALECMTTPNQIWEGMPYLLLMLRIRYSVKQFFFSFSIGGFKYTPYNRLFMNHNFSSVSFYQMNGLQGPDMCH